jgi:predicted amidohydrolase
LIASPLGEVVAQANADLRLVVADIDLAAVTSARDTLAVLRNRAQFVGR